LGQIHPNWIVGPGIVLDFSQQVLGAQGKLGIVLFVVVQNGPVQIVFNVQRLDRVFDKIDRLLGPNYRFVIQTVDNCVVQNVAPRAERCRVVLGK